MSGSDPPKLDYATQRTQTEQRRFLSAFVHGRWPPLILVIGGPAILLLLSVTTAPSPGTSRLLLVGLLGITTTGTWIAMVGTRMGQRYIPRPRPRRWHFRRLASWLFPILLLLSIVSARFLVGPRVAAWISTPAARRLSQQPTTAALPASLADRRIGVFAARDIERIPGGVTFTVGSIGTHAVYGYCYTDAGNPRPPGIWQGPVILYPLGDGWWLWEWRE